MVVEWKAARWWHEDSSTSMEATQAVLVRRSRGDTDVGGRDERWMGDGLIGGAAWMAHTVSIRAVSWR